MNISYILCRLKVQYGYRDSEAQKELDAVKYIMVIG